jgi:hypothetical protein
MRSALPSATSNAGIVPHLQSYHPGDVRQKYRHELCPRIYTELLEQLPDVDMHRTGADSNPPGSFSFGSTPKQVPKCLPLSSCQARTFNRNHRRRRSGNAVQNRQHAGHRLIDPSDGFNVPLPIIEQTLELTGKIGGENHELVVNEKTSNVNSEEQTTFADGITNDDMVKIIGGVVLAIGSRVDYPDLATEAARMVMLELVRMPLRKTNFGSTHSTRI